MGFAGVLCVCGGRGFILSAVRSPQSAYLSIQSRLHLICVLFVIFAAFSLCLFGHGNTLIKKLSHKTWQRRRKMKKKIEKKKNARRTLTAKMPEF